MRWRTETGSLAVRFDKAHEIVTTAWIGVTGQDEYEMIIVLGNMPFERCLKELDLKDCLPEDQTLDWVNLDEANCLIILQLK